MYYFGMTTFYSFNLFKIFLNLVGSLVLLKGNFYPQNLRDYNKRRIKAIPISFLSGNSVLPF